MRTSAFRNLNLKPKSQLPPDLSELQHLAELGRLSASLLHEISNPLTAAWLNLEQLSDFDAPGLRQAKRSISVLRRYVEAARQQVRHRGDPIGFSLNPQISQVKRIVSPLAKNAGVKLKFESTPACRLYGDPVKLQQIISNLVINAIEAYQPQVPNSLDKVVSVRFQLNSNYLLVSVHDWGKGIAFSELRRIFEPFYTTKQQKGHGLGIGLSIVNNYVTHDFGGSIIVRSSRRAGTRFIVKIPLVGSHIKN